MKRGSELWPRAVLGLPFLLSHHAPPPPPFLDPNHPTTASHVQSVGRGGPLDERMVRVRVRSAVLWGALGVGILHAFFSLFTTAPHG